MFRIPFLRTVHSTCVRLQTWRCLSRVPASSIQRFLLLSGDEKSSACSDVPFEASLFSRTFSHSSGFASSDLSGSLPVRTESFRSSTRSHFIELRTLPGWIKFSLFFFCVLPVQGELRFSQKKESLSLLEISLLVLCSFVLRE